MARKSTAKSATRSGQEDSFHRSKLDNRFWHYIAFSVLDGFTVHHIINQNKTCRRQNIMRSLHHGIR